MDYGKYKKVIEDIDALVAKLNRGPIDSDMESLDIIIAANGFSQEDVLPILELTRKRIKEFESDPQNNIH